MVVYNRETMVTLYSKSNCQGCVATKRFLTANQIDYIEKNVEDSEENMSEALSFGFQQMPIVATENDSWFGFDPSKLSGLVKV